MKAVILAGGFGSRLSEETTLRPKPMVEVGGRPILWHIMNIYAAYQVNEFIIAIVRAVRNLPRSLLESRSLGMVSHQDAGYRSRRVP